MKALLPTRIAQCSKNDTTANLRINRHDSLRWGLKEKTEYVFGLKHSDGVIVSAAGRTTKALDKCYLSGCGVVDRYVYTSPRIGDTRPVEIVSVNEIQR